jgi:hypothetical protein
VPYIALWPAKIAAGATCDEPINSVDLYPTLLAAGGVTAPAGYTLDGTSYLNLLTSGGGAAAGRNPLYWHFPGYLGATAMAGGPPRQARSATATGSCWSFSRPASSSSTTCATTPARRPTWPSRGPPRPMRCTPICAPGDGRWAVGAPMPTPNPPPAAGAPAQPQKAAKAG